jgi:site-specific DNA-methyltransferase (adenine-specific)
MLFAEPHNSMFLGALENLMPRIPDNCVDMVLTDLPYGTTQNRWDTPIDLAFFWKEVGRFSKYTAAIALTSSQPFTSTLVVSNPSQFRHEWIWVKNMGSNFVNTVREPMKEHESVLIFSRGQWIYNKQLQERSESGKARAKRKEAPLTKSDNYRVFTGSRNVRDPLARVPSSHQKFNVERGLHPTQKPVALFEYLIRTYTNANDVVLDCCAGSGTTAIAAINANRRFVLFERDEAYYQAADARIRAHILARGDVLPSN